MRAQGISSKPQACSKHSSFPSCWNSLFSSWATKTCHEVSKFCLFKQEVTCSRNFSHFCEFHVYEHCIDFLHVSVCDSVLPLDKLLLLHVLQFEVHTSSFKRSSFSQRNGGLGSSDLHWGWNCCLQLPQLGKVGVCIWISEQLCDRMMWGLCSVQGILDSVKENKHRLPFPLSWALHRSQMAKRGK